jgi:LacI family transcriptional regulator
MKPAPGRRVTLSDIARACGLSRAGVSLALRNSSRIAKATRKRVQALAEEMGYRPHPLAAGLANLKRSSPARQVHSVIGWINCWTDPAKLRGYGEFDGYWRGAEACARKFGYRLEEFTLGSNMSLSRLEKVLLARGIAALLLPPHEFPVDWGDFNWDRFSVVRFGRSLPSPRAHIVTSDQAGNAMMAFDAIRERGYRRIGGVREKKSDDRVYHRTRLFEAGFLSMQFDIDPEQVVPIVALDPDKPRSHRQILTRWFQQEQPDAIFTESSLITLLTECGYRVPHDIGVAGTTLLDTDATAGIDQHPEEIGRVGVLVLLSQVNDNARGVPEIFRQVLIEGDWVDGPSLPWRRPAPENH